MLLTGGAGFIGMRLLKALAKSEYRVAVMDCLLPQVHPERETSVRRLGGARLILGDVADCKDWDGTLNQFAPDIVVHLAAETATGQSLDLPGRQVRTNVMGTAQMLEAFVRNGKMPKHIVLASSRAVYGEGCWRRGDERTYPHPRSHRSLSAGQWDPVSGPGWQPVPHRAGLVDARPASVYAATKLAQEHLLAAWTSAKGVSLTVLRLQNVYGPGQSWANPYTGVLVHFAACALRGEPIRVYEDGKIIRDFVHIDDVCDAFMLAITDNQPPATPRVFDIGSGQPELLLDVAHRVAALCRGTVRVTNEFRDGDVRAAAADVAQSKAELGFTPRRSLDSGLRDLIGWVAAELKCKRERSPK